MTRDEFDTETGKIAQEYAQEHGVPVLILALDAEGRPHGGCKMSDVSEDELWKMLSWLKRFEASTRKAFLGGSTADPDEMLAGKAK